MMQEFAGTSSRQRHAQGPVAPVCLACGNRSLFLLETVHGCSGLPVDQVLELPDFTGVRCGRCRCHHCIVIEYDD